MMARNGEGPDDQSGDVAELRGTTQVVGEYDYDTPTVDEIQQAETGYPDRAIPVEVVGSVRVDELPSKTGGIFSRTVTTTTPYRLNADPRRKAVTILALDTDIRIGRTQADALMAGAGAQWPAAVPLVMQSSDELWILALVAQTAVSFIVENWAS